MRTKSLRLPALTLTLLFALAPLVIAAPQDRATTLGILNQPPTFTSDPSDNGSDGTSPTSVGVNVSFSATATDPNDDNYYVAICKTAAITPGASAAPTCDGESWGDVSAATTSGEPVDPIVYMTLVGDVESNDWFAYVCDGNGAGGSGDPDHQCSAVSNSESPFNVNHRPVIGVVTAGNAYGSNDSVDPGAGGVPVIVTTDFGTSDDFGQSVAIQDDGKIVEVGFSNAGGSDVFALTRYDTDGSLDLTFGSGTGKVTTSFGGGNESRARAVLIYRSGNNIGKILVAGYSNNGIDKDFALARYTADGVLDLTFSGDGMQTTDIVTGDDDAYSIALNAAGRIVAVGEGWSGTTMDFAVAQYLPNGTLDIEFSGDGKLTTAIGTQIESAQSVALQSDGKIVVAGGTDNSFGLARYNSDGTLDASFGTDGIVVTATASPAYAVAIQPDGKIVAAGRAHGAFALARYNSDGSLDTTFDGDLDMSGYPGNGFVMTYLLSDYETVYSLALQPDGKIVAGGASNGSIFALVRYNTDGSLDTGFDTDGKVTLVIGGTNFIHSIAIQADGKIVAAVESYNGTNADFAWVRYTAGGAVDSSAGNGSVFVRAVVTDPDTDTVEDTISMYVCSSATTAFDPATATCTGGTLLCSATGVASGGNADCTYADGAPIPTAPAEYPFKVYLRDSHDFGDGGNGGSYSYAVTDIAPTVDTYSVNDINPTAGGSVFTSFTVLVSDDNGWADIDTVNGLIYDSASGSGGTALSSGTCTPNERNCYLRAACSKAESTATQITATCNNIETFFNINPTSPGVWKAHVNAIDGGGTPRTVVGADSSTDIAVGALSAVAVAQDSIAYGPIVVGGTSSSSQPTTMQNVGNIQIDVGIHGTNMIDGSHSIPLAKQRWATDTGFSYGTGDHPLVADPEAVPGNADQGCANRSVAVRASHASIATDSNIFWKLQIPDPQATGSYAGTNTFTSIVDGLCTGSDGSGGGDVCGDGLLTGSETCDDGGVIPGDGCSDVCAIESGYSCNGEPSVCNAIVCGNETIDPGETCDNLATDMGGNCSVSCQAELSCPGDPTRTLFVGNQGSAGCTRYNGDQASCELAFINGGSGISSCWYDSEFGDCSGCGQSWGGCTNVCAGPALFNLVTPVGSWHDYAYSVATYNGGANDGKTVIAGWERSANDFTLVRYNTDGTLDGTFGTGGITTSDIATDIDKAYSVAIYGTGMGADAGKIVAAGIARVGTINHFAVARYTTAGVLDTTFNTTGTVLTDIGGSENDEAYSVAIDAGGKVVVAGYNYNFGLSRNEFVVARYTTGGLLDTDFGGGDGVVTTDIGSGAEAYSVAIRSTGEIVVAGTNSSDFTVAQYTSSGVLDTANFGSGTGIVSTNLGDDDRAKSVAIDADGKVVVAGVTGGSPSIRFATARYTAAGVLDTATFNSGGSQPGIVIATIGTKDDIANSVAIQSSDGKIVVAGNTVDDTQTTQSFALVRYNTNGTLDSTFDTDGIVTTSMGNMFDGATPVSIAIHQSDGKIMAAGSTYSGGVDNDFALVRYTSTGAVDVR